MGDQGDGAPGDFCVLDAETFGGTWESFPTGFELLVTGVRHQDSYAAYTAGPASLAQLAGFLDAFQGPIVTFNGGKFDLPLLDHWFERVLGRRLHVTQHYDLLAEIYRAAGYRISLDRVAQYTFGEKKVPWDHRQNERLWAEEPHRMIAYNRRDLDLTHELYVRVRGGRHLFLGDKTVLLPPHPSATAAE